MKKHIIILTLALALTRGTVFADYSGKITYQIQLTVEQTSKTAALWLPYPLSDQYQTISNVQINGNFDISGIYREPTSEVVYFYAAWKEISAQPVASLSFHADLKNRTLEKIVDSGDPLPVHVHVQKYTIPSRWVTSDYPKIKLIADMATMGKQTTLEKVQGVYDWVVENTFRDPTVRGCGLAIPTLTLHQQNGGGKCADISAVFVTVARAAGIAARDIYGLRLTDPKNGDITNAFHCWAEFYLPGTGWVPVDPADVRKMMLVHKLEEKDTNQWRTFFWGGDDLFRIVLEKNARGVMFQPAQQGDPLNYFMYPFAQVDGKTLDYFNPQEFTYTVDYQEY